MVIYYKRLQSFSLLFKYECRYTRDGQSWTVVEYIFIRLHFYSTTFLFDYIFIRYSFLIIRLVEGPLWRLNDTNKWGSEPEPPRLGSRGPTRAGPNLVGYKFSLLKIYSLFSNNFIYSKSVFEG